MQRKIVKLRFEGPVHFGTARLDYTKSQQRLCSDTLYAAILMVWAKLGMTEPLEALASATPPGVPDFTLSSAFPFCRDELGKTIYFLPRIHKPFDSSHRTTAELLRQQAKRFKKIQYFSTAAFYQHCASSKGYQVKDLKHLQGAFLCETPIPSDLTHRQMRQRASISRSGQDTALFQVEQTYLDQRSGLYFLLETPDKKTLQQVAAALKCLQYDGLGSDKNLGYGAFQYELADWPEEINTLFRLPQQNTLFTNLSLYRPVRGELSQLISSSKYCSYELVKRGGWMTMPPHLSLRKKSLYFFAEGSLMDVASQLNGVVAGSSQNVRPNLLGDCHPVWRIGKSFFVPVHLNKV